MKTVIFEKTKFIFCHCLVICIGVMLQNNASCQNLVQNPGFETTTTCPSAISQISYATGWNNPDQNGTPDAYNNGGACNYLPSNSGLGTNLPHSGSGMAGIYCYRTTITNREYLVNSLNAPMVVGQPYTVSFWVSLATTSGWSINNIGVYFSVSNPPCTNTSAPCSASSVLMPVSPQLLVNSTISTAWTQYTFTFTPTAAFNKMTIGRFAADNAANQVDVPPLGNTAYLLFDDFVVTPTSPLPVELSSFSADCAEDHSVIRWTTSSEHNHSFFTLDKSCDGVDFQNIATIEGNGAGQNESSYFINDYELTCPGVSYYRLTQTDLDGNTTSYPYSAVSCEPQNARLISYDHELNQLILHKMDNIESFTLYNSTGQIIIEIPSDDLTSNNYSLPHLSPGLYLVSIKTYSNENILQKSFIF